MGFPQKAPLAMAQLTEKKVRNAGYFKRADAEAYQLSLAVLMSLGAQVAGQTARLTRYVAGYDKVGWSGNTIDLSDSRQRKTLAGLELVHQAVHSLVSYRFGSKYRGRPRLTLLAEALAGATELYFSLQYIGNGGDPAKCTIYRTYCHSSRQSKISFIKKFNTLIDDPFKAYKENVAMSYQISIALFDTLEKRIRGKAFSSDRLEKVFERNSHILFLRHHDFGNFALFAGNYCGFKSTKQDKKAYDECIALLKSSNSYVEFLKKLGAAEVIQKNK